MRSPLTPTFSPFTHAALVAFLSACAASSTTPDPDTSGSAVRWPVAVEDHSRLTGVFGEYLFLPDNTGASHWRYHTGLDIASATGSGGLTVVAAASGTLAKIQLNDLSCTNGVGCADHGFGNTVFIKHTNSAGATYYTQYSHLAAIEASVLAQCQLPTARSTRFTCPGTATITIGTTVGTMGGSGFGSATAYGVHLHFAVNSTPTLGATLDDSDPNGDYGYIAGPPETGTTRSDPMLTLLATSRASASLVSVKMSTAIRLGPGNSFPLVNDIYPSTPATTIAHIHNGDCSTDWLEVELGDPAAFIQYNGPDLGFGSDSSSWRRGWICDGAPPGAPAGIFFVTAGGLSGLYFTVPTSSLAKLYGPVRTALGTVLDLIDLARAPNGVLWGISREPQNGGDRLYAIDPLTGAATNHGALGLGSESANAATFDPTGRLLVGTYPGGLIAQVDTVSGRATTLGSMLGGFASSGDLAFAPNGVLYASSAGAPNDVLVRLDPANGYRATPVKAGATIGFSQVWGLSAFGTDLFGFAMSGSTPVLLRFDLVLGSGTIVRTLKPQVNGSALRNPRR